MLKLLPGLPPQASAHAAEIDHVLGLEHLMMLVLFLFWSGYFVYVLFRFRSGAHKTASYHGIKGTWSVYLVFLVGIAEGALLIGYEIPQWRDRLYHVPPADQSTVVRVVGQQFAWNVHYPGKDGRFGRTDIALVSPDNPLGLDRRDPDAKDDITTINLLTVPVGRPVVVHLTSLDVIHSLGIYEMRVKQDATPGVDTPVWFVPTVTTAEMRRRLNKPDFEYEITCSQLCGLGHFRMRAFLSVVTDEDYQRFLTEEAPPATP
jgi:cytochrome c oxidase subunit 2